MKIRTLLMASMLTSGLAQADLMSDANKLKDIALGSSLGYEIVESLTVEVGPRIAGSDGDKRAVAWAEAKLNALGFDKVYKEPVRVRNWERGLAEARVTAPFPQDLVVTALGGTIGTPDDGMTREVIMFPSLDDLKTASPDQVKGKIVFINKRMKRDINGAGYGPVVGARARGAVEAAKLGADAIIIRSVGTDSTRFAHTGGMRYEEGVRKIPAGAISNVDADTLEAIFAREKPVSIFFNMKAKEHGWQTSYNVVGEFTGTEKPEEIVLIGAHLDSWDEGTGALDDGAGVGIVTATAKLIKEHFGTTRRTIRVVLFANEEFGLVGAREYARKHKDELPNIVFASESDFGAGRVHEFGTRFGPEGLKFADKVMKALANLDIKRGGNEAYGGPDVSPLARQGVPVADLAQDGTYYFDYHHTPNDTLDKIDKGDMAQNIAAWTVVTFMVANSDIDLRK